MRRKLLRLYHGFLYILEVLLYFISFPLAFILYKQKHAWLISEIDFDARDNGYFFASYLKTEHPEINSFYIISSKNKNYNKVCGIANTVEPHSYKHLLLFIAADFKICTLVHGCSHNYYHAIFLKKHHGPGKNICLKHGIFKNFHPNYLRENAHLDLICCGGFPEYKFIKNSFNYSDEVVHYTGLARYDNLHFNIESKFILFMPTWRQYLEKLSFEEFKNSEFFLNWMSIVLSLINNEKYSKLIIYFYLHPKLNKFKDLFLNIERVKVLNSKSSEIDIQDCLKKCQLLLTDYSSVYFDVAYMKKPILYFQFDKKEFAEFHYADGYFNYERDGFGKVCCNKNELLNEIENLFDNNFVNPALYLNRSDDFFTLNDSNNCERIFNAILGLNN